jgi:hypothetical protein
MVAVIVSMVLYVGAALLGVMPVILGAVAVNSGSDCK